jgi:hypothetical protein
MVLMVTCDLLMGMVSCDLPISPKIWCQLLALKLTRSRSVSFAKRLVREASRSRSVSFAKRLEEKRREEKGQLSNLLAKMRSIASSTTLSGVEAPEVTPTTILPVGSQFSVISSSLPRGLCSIRLLGKMRASLSIW